MNLIKHILMNLNFIFIVKTRKKFITCSFYAPMLMIDNISQPLIPTIRSGCEHAFYVWAALINQWTGEPKGPLPAPFKRGYLRPLYELPAFKDKAPVKLDVVEEVERDIILVEVCSIDPTDAEIVQMVEDLGRVL